VNDELIEAKLKAMVMRYSAARRLLVETLRQGPGTIPDLMTRGGLAESSTYRNLHVLMVAGVVNAAGTVGHGHPVWSLRAEGEPSTCVACGHLLDGE
jgi:hypothetical protein